jgi:TolB-like protein
MFAKKIVSVFITMLFVLAAGVAHSAGSARSYAVFPFEVNGPSQYQYLSRGVQSMMSSRLNWTGHFEPIPGSKDLSEKDRPSGKIEELKTAQRLSADYLILGTLMVAGDDVSVDVKITNKDGKVWNKNSKTNINDLIPSLDDLAKDIQSDLFEKPGQTSEDRAKEKKLEAARPDGPNNPFIVMASSAGKPMESKINPQFRYEGGASTPGMWRSQSVNIVNRGGFVADVTGDGKANFVILTDSEVIVYDIIGQHLKKNVEYNLFARSNPLRVSGIDLDGDGVQEVVATSLRDDRAHSFIISFKNGVARAINDDLKLFLTVVRMPPSFTPSLVGQKVNSTRTFYSKDVTEYMLSKGKLMPVRKLRVPQFTNVFNLSYLPQKDGYKVLVIGKRGNIAVYNKDLEPLYQSEESYNSTPVKVELGSNFAGLNPDSAATKMESYLFIPMPVLIASISDPAKQEVLLNRDVSVASQLFSNYRSFSQGEIHSEFWDGVGLNLAWKTRRIKGTVTSYGLADVDNDGEDELYCILNTFPGALGIKYRKTFLVSYELSLPGGK